jgi:hypothetical protein
MSKLQTPTLTSNATYAFYLSIGGVGKEDA